MKHFLITTLVMASLSLQHLLAQTYVAQVKTESGKWGYANIKGDMVIQAWYLKCYEFSDNLATVYDEETTQFYFLDISGKILKTDITRFKIDEGFYGYEMKLFSDGLIAVKKGKWGYLNTSGKLVIPLQYEEVTDFDKGYAIARLGYDYFIINHTGDRSSVNIKDIKGIKHFSEGLAPFYAYDGRNLRDNAGYIDTIGKIAIQATFKSLGFFKNGIAWAKTFDDKVGYINYSGEWIIKPIFDEAHDFDPESGLARIKINGKFAYTDKTGKLLYVDTDDYDDFRNGLAKGEKNGKVGFFNSKGEWVIQTQFDGARSFKNGYAAVKIGNKWGIIDKEGKWIIPAKFFGIKDMELVY